MEIASTSGNAGCNGCRYRPPIDALLRFGGEQSSGELGRASNCPPTQHEARNRHRYEKAAARLVNAEPPGRE
jgi:hypothetical protein